MGSACSSNQQPANADANVEMPVDLVSPVMTAVAVPMQGGAEPTNAQVNPMDRKSHDAAAMSVQEAPAQEKPVANAEDCIKCIPAGWSECVNCDVTHELVREGVYRDLRTGEVIVDSNHGIVEHRTSQTQPAVHPEQIMYEEAPIHENIEQVSAPVPYTQPPMAPESPAHQMADEGGNNNIFVGAVAIHRGEDIDEMAQEPVAYEEPVAEQAEELPQAPLAAMDRGESMDYELGGEQSENAPEPEKKRKRKKKRSRGLPRKSRGGVGRHPEGARPGKQRRRRKEGKDRSGKWFK